MDNLLRLLVVFVFVFCLAGCGNEKQRHSRADLAKTQNALVKVNKVLVAEDRDLIEGYIKRHKLEGMKETGTGLYYFIWGNPMGDSIKVGDEVEYLYKITLLDGTLCYQSQNNAPKKFKVGMGGVESGLEQAVLLMRAGQKGKFILPPHLAFGLLGDEDKIPGRSIIVYDIEMLNVYK